MIRVTAGIYRGRRIFTGNTLKARPAISVIRESVFNILRSYMPIYGIRVCDLFCGSGSFSFEALSRGADYACLVDIHAPNLHLVKKTAASLGVEDKVGILCCDVRKLPRSDYAYDLVFVDPPYPDTELVSISLKALLDLNWCRPESIIVVRIKKGDKVPLPDRCELLSRRCYCGSEVIFMSVKDFSSVQ